MDKKFIEAMKSQRFGVELELTGITRQDVRNILAEYLGRSDLMDSKGRDWNIKYDSSIYGRYRYNGSLMETSSNDYKVELVTPILEYDDIEMLQEIVRLIRRAGGVSTSDLRCGLHIHICEEGQTEKTLRNLIRLFSSKQYLLERALSIPNSRLSQYCQYVDENLMRRCNRNFRSMNALKQAWENTSDRYSMLNLSSLFSGKGIELRCFNGTTHAGVVKAYIQFSLAVCQSAKSLSRVSSGVPKNDLNDRYAMRTWLCRMNLSGDEFKTCRKHMTKNLSGDTAFASPDRRKNSDDFSESELPIY